MCICFFMVGEPGSPYPFIFCGNRDEFYSRESIQFGQWSDAKEVYGGRDAVRGGTWLGIRPNPSPSGPVRYRFAVVHNFRHSDMADPQKKTRGDLPTDFLKGRWSAKEYAEKVARDGPHYMGFTLILVDETGVYFTSNRASPVRRLEPGMYSLSNASLDTPWPKVSHGKEMFRVVLREFYPRIPKDRAQEEALFHNLCTRVLRDNTLFPHPLPGIHDAQTEILLSPIFIDPYKWKDWGFYGTRMQTVCAIRSDGSAKVEEYSLDTKSSIQNWRGEWSRVCFELCSKGASRL